jgi:voltage-gated potassium channel
MSQQENDFQAYDLFVAILAIVAMVLVTAWFFLPEASEIRVLIHQLDLGICAIFLFDFFRSLLRSQNRWRYFVTWGWFDLLSSVPAVAQLRYFRVARVLRLIRVIRSLRILAQILRRDPASASFAGLFLLWSLAFIFICVGVLIAEKGAPDSTLHTADNVLWWAVVTSSTVGYGEVYPVTPAGRLLAGAMMVLGIGTFATITSGFGVWFTRLQNQRKGTRSLSEGTVSLVDLDDRLQRIEELLQKSAKDPDPGK